MGQTKVQETIAAQFSDEEIASMIGTPRRSRSAGAVVTSKSKEAASLSTSVKSRNKRTPIIQEHGKHIEKSSRTNKGSAKETKKLEIVLPTKRSVRSSEKIEKTEKGNKPNSIRINSKEKSKYATDIGNKESPKQDISKIGLRKSARKR